MNPSGFRIVPLNHPPKTAKPRMVVIELHLLGDLVLAIPFLNAAVKNYEVHVICRPHCAPLLKDFLPADQVHSWNPPWEPDPGVPANTLQKIVRFLRQLRPQFAVNSWPDARVGWLVWLSGAKVRVGFPMLYENYHAAHVPWRARNQFWGRLLEILILDQLYSKKLRRLSTKQHRIKDWEQIAKSLGLEFHADPPWWKVEPVFPKRSERIVLGVAPHNRSSCKTWPEKLFAETAKKLIMEEIIHEVHVLCPSSFEATRSWWPKESVFLHTRDFSSLAAALLECAILLANDSFPGHLAASLGVPVVTIFGSSSPDWFRPWGVQNTALRAGNCPHHPCLERCVMPEFFCLKELTPAEAARAVKASILSIAKRQEADARLISC